MAFQSVNPATGEKIARFDRLWADQLEEKLTKTGPAFDEQRRSSFTTRARLMRAAAGRLDSERERYARIITTEVGKPIVAAREEVNKCASVCRFYAENAERFLAPEESHAGATRTFIRYEPVGAVLAIMPWNFPFWQVLRFAAPALMSGNVGLLKHAANVPQCALAIEEIFRDAGFADGAFQSLLIDTDQTEALIGDSRVRAVTLTGSERAGSTVASVAARAIKKSVLELGGSDPFIVMPSADFETAVATAVKARTINAGQSCIAAKRFLVAAPIYDAFVAAFVTKMRALRVGDPSDEATDVGPLATEAIRDGVHAQVEKSIAAGARALCGAKRLAGPGFFYEPTVLVDVPPDSPAAREEVFGPVASFFRIKDAVEAIALANDTSFGLGASAWTTDAAEQELFISELEAGLVFINQMVASDPQLPFGGTKRSGFGRELGVHGIREFMNVKTVVISR